MTITTRSRKPRTRLIAVVTAVVVVAAASVYVMLQIPNYRTAFLVDTAATTVDEGADTDFKTITNAVGSAAQNTADSDALSPRRFGGACGNPSNTAQIVGSGTNHGQKISDALQTLTPGGTATLESGILATIDDFSGVYPFRGWKSNRIIVVTRHGTDACTSDQTELIKMIRNRIDTAGLQLDFRFIGYGVPIEQQNVLTQVAAAVGAPKPEFIQTAASLATTLKQLTIPESPEAAQIKIPGLTPSNPTTSPPTEPPPLASPSPEPPPLAQLMLNIYISNPDTTVRDTASNLSCNGLCHWPITAETQVTLISDEAGSIPTNWVGCDNTTSGPNDLCNVMLINNNRSVCLVPYDPYQPDLVTDDRCQSLAGG